MKTALDTHYSHDDGPFDQFATAIQAHFAKVVANGQPIFTCKPSSNLYDVYLDSFHSADERQHHTCHCCRQFIERFGNLVVIDPETGKQQSAIWPDSSYDFPAEYQGAATDLRYEVAHAKVDGVFVAKEKTWGTPEAGGFSHFHLKPPASLLHRDRLLTPYQVMAQKKQDFGTLSHGLADFTMETVKTAMSLLETDSLYRSEKVVGPARFLLNLHALIDGIKNRALRSNLIWLAVALAPVGFATPRSSMVGTLLEDIAEGMSFETVKRRFASKMHPLQYQRPQAPTRAGNIAQAEKIVEQLGIANSLKRRFARLDEMRLLWSPKAKVEQPKAGGVFSHLMQSERAAPQLTAKFGAITWAKFASKVLPTAERISVLLEGNMNFCGVVTAVDPDAPPILQWDHEDNRNPVSWYVYNGGSNPHQWGLTQGRWEDVAGISLKPCMWNGEDHYPHFGKSAILILPNAQDRRKHGLSIFPETLKSDLHSIRSTIEAFSNAGELTETDQATANGILVGEKSQALVRVTTSLGTTEYRIDRWD